MADAIKEKEKQLAELEVEEEIASKRAEIAEKKALEHDMKKKYGRDWRKLFGGFRKAIRPNKEVIEDLYCMGGDNQRRLRDMSRPDKIRVGR